MRRIPALVFASLALVVASLSAKAAAQDGDAVALVAPAEGELACGSSGRGRMASPQAIFEALA